MNGLDTNACFFLLERCLVVVVFSFRYAQFKNRIKVLTRFCDRVTFYTVAYLLPVNF